MRTSRTAVHRHSTLKYTEMCMYTYIQTGDNKDYRTAIHELIIMNDLLHTCTDTYNG